MYWEANAQHHLPHFHAYYQDSVAVYTIGPIDRIAGEMPRRQERLIQAWAELHSDELAADWDRLQDGRAAMPIDPLR